MKTLYIIGTGPDGRGEGEGIYSLVADDGEGLASHLCSGAGYAKGDLHDRRPERIEEWTKRFGDYKVIWLGEDDMKFETLLELNKNHEKTNIK